MAAPSYQYGFRHDPMEWVESSASLDAAIVRRQVFARPNPGDEALLQKRIDEILAAQNEDGTLSDDPQHRYQFTCDALNRLADLGVDPERDEVRRTVGVVLREKDEESADPIGIYTVRALCRLGMGDHPEVKAGLEHLVAREAEWNGPWAGCPWTPIEHLQTLWLGREVLDSTELIDSVLTWIATDMNAAGCLTYKDPWGFLRIAGFVDLPVARRIVERQIPMILRGQRTDGGWGDNSLHVLRALVTHGLLDELRQPPPLPADWRVVDEIPAPEGKLATMTWDGERLWVNDRDGAQAIALSPEDGSVQHRVSLPAGKSVGIGWWDGGLAVTQSEPKRLLKLDPETGSITREIPLEYGEWLNGVAQVNGEVWVADGFEGCVWRIDADDPAEHESLVLGAPIPMDLAAASDGVWHTDIFAPALVKNDREGKLVDWGERPFGGHAIAWDGNSLWALDNAHRRICRIEKTASGRSLTGASDLRQRARHGSCDVWLEDLRLHETRHNQLGNLLACARYLGYEGPEAWIAGATGFAFALNVGDDLCPSGPSAWADHRLLPLAANAGLHIETLFGNREQGDFAARQRQAFARVRESIDAAMPVIGCDMATPEVYLITGYDDGGHYLFIDFATGETARLHHENLGFIWQQFPALGPSTDDRAAVRAALTTAAALAAGEGFDSSSCGLRSYDNWIAGLADAQDGKPGFGAAYNAACWADCRRFAVPFLLEAKRRLDDETLAPHSDEAIRRYRVASDNLDEVAALFPFVFGEDEQMVARFRDDARRRQAREALTAARSAEEAGVAALRSLLEAM